MKYDGQMNKQADRPDQTRQMGEVIIMCQPAYTDNTKITLQRGKLCTGFELLESFALIPGTKAQSSVYCLLQSVFTFVAMRYLFQSSLLATLPGDLNSILSFTTG